eukprot:175231_1
METLTIDTEKIHILSTDTDESTVTPTTQTYTKEHKISSARGHKLPIIVGTMLFMVVAALSIIIILILTNYFQTDGNINSENDNYFDCIAKCKQNNVPFDGSICGEILNVSQNECPYKCNDESDKFYLRNSYYIEETDDCYCYETSVNAEVNCFDVIDLNLTITQWDYHCTIC